MHEADMATMEVVSNECTRAWRKACNGDQAGSLALLKDLDKRYPGVLTIQMMTGQVYDHFGNRKEAIEHYRRCVTGNEFSSLHVFKLAEAMRKNGDYKGAEGYYRKVLQSAPKFAAAQLGLARCLLATDKQSSEARTLLSDAATDEQSAKEAQALLDQLEPGAKAGN
jgi:thioredoxin-like negative regulator of GroEL